MSFKPLGAVLAATFVLTAPSDDAAVAMPPEVKDQRSPDRTVTSRTMDDATPRVPHSLSLPHVPGGLDAFALPRRASRG